MPAPTPKTTEAPAELAAALDVYDRILGELSVARAAQEAALAPYQPRIDRLLAAETTISERRHQAVRAGCEAAADEIMTVERLHEELASALGTAEKAAKAARAASPDATAFRAGTWLAKTTAKAGSPVVDDEAAAQTDIAKRWPMFLDEVFPRKLARAALKRLWPTLRDREHEGQKGIAGVADPDPDWTVTLDRIAEPVEEEAAEASA